MKRKFTFLMAALALLCFMLPPMTGWGQSDYSTVYSGNVTLSTTGGTSASTCVVVINSNNYDGIKAGTGKVAGAVKITVPADSKYLHLHVAGWKGESVTLAVTPSGYSDNISLTANDGISNNSPFTFDGDPSTSDYYKVITFENALDEDTDLTFTATSGKRFVVWGVNAEAAVAPGTYILSSAVTPTGAGTVALSETSLEEDETATATATANEHFTFTSWSITGEGASLSSTTDNPTTVTMGTENATITATFTEDPKYDITYNANYEGSTDAPVVVSNYAGETMTIADYSTFSRTGYNLTSWNTKANGNGTTYNAGAGYTMTSAGLTLYAQWEVSNEVIDHLTYTLIGVSGTNYTEWSGKTSVSDAVYAGKTAGGNNSIQLNATTTNGIKSTTSGGLVRNITIAWNSNTSASGRKIIVYGSNEPLTGMTSSNSLGEINRNETSLDITGDYAYIGIVGNGGACYLDDIYITWEPVAAPTVATPTYSVDGIGSGNVFVEMAAVTITAPDYNTHYIYYTTDGSDPDDSSTPYDGTPISISSIGNTTVKAIAYDEDLHESSIGSVEVTIVETTDISDVYSAADDNSTYYYIEGKITYISGNSNMYVEDNTGGILVYGTHTGCAVGNGVVIKGTKTTYNELPEFKNITILDNDGLTNTLPETAINISQIGGYMFRRVKFTQVLVGSTTDNLTTISQGANSVGVYNIPAIENVTEEGYYLKTITGVVASYNSNTQLYVASDGDITIYDVDASSNNTTLGTVTTNGYMVIATPASGATYDDPAYEVVTSATYSVTKTDNNFKVITNGDLLIEIQFVASTSPCTITYHVNGTIGSFSSYETKYQNSSIGELPTTEGIGGLTFVGWSTSENDTDIIDGTYAIGAVTSLDLYAVYSRTVSKTETKVEIIDGNLSGLTSTQTSVSTVSDLSKNDFSYKATGVKFQAVQSGAENNFATSDANQRAIMIGKAGAYFYNTTAFGNGITKFEVYANKGASTSVSVGINFSTSTISEYDAQATNTWTETLNPNDHVYDASSALPTDAKYFWYQVTNGYNSQVQFRITYTVTTNTTTKFTRVFLNETASAPIDITGPSIIPSGYTLNMGNNDLTNSYDATKLIIEDGAQLKTQNAVEGTVEKNITGYGSSAGGYYLIAAPGEIDFTGNYGFLPANDSEVDFYYFDQAIEGIEWRNLKYGNDIFAGPIGLSRGTGYLYANKNNTTLIFNTEKWTHPSMNGNYANSPFVPTDVNQTIPVTYTNGVKFAGYNLIGNPFTCTAYLSDNRDFLRMNADGNAIVLATDKAINVCEGIFVMATATEEYVTLTTTEPTPDGASGSNNGMVNISVDQVVNSRDTQPSADYARIRINNGKDLPKFVFNESTSRVYIPQNGKDYAVVRSEAQGELPMNFKAAENGTYTINVATENLDVDYLHLIDNLTGTDVDLLATPSYTFESRKNDYASRFRLRFSANNNDNSVSDEFAFVSNGEIVILNEGEATLQVIDMLGRTVSTQAVNGNARIDKMSANGVYVLRLIDGNEVKTQKIVIE